MTDAATSRGLARPQGRFRLLAAAAAAALCLTACGSVADRARGGLFIVTPYSVEVVQGNFVSREQVDLLKAGMSRQQVREILGTPLLTDVFHSNRWDYVFTIRRQGVLPQQRSLTLFFSGELLDRYAGDEMPTEQGFVATVDTRKSVGKVPRLEASAEELRKFALAKPEPSAVVAAPTAPLPASYPPLESNKQ